MKVNRFILIGICFLFSNSIFSQDKPLYSWLTGNWIGDGFGGTSEESWSMPSEDGTMMGMYRHHNEDGNLNFYEFMILDKNGLRLKHFHPDLVGWEEKADYLTFDLIKYDERTIELEGLTFHYFEPDSMEIHLKMKTKEGSKTEVFHMKRN